MIHDGKVLKAIGELVDYLEHDEAKHWEEMVANNENAANHIYHSVMTVADWLETKPGHTYEEEAP